jgi:hypothetical protein
VIAQLQLHGYQALMLLPLAGLVIGILYNKTWSIEKQWYIWGLSAVANIAAERDFDGTPGPPSRSYRAVHRVLNLARTIADLAGSDAIHLAHLAEAIQYRRRRVALVGLMRLLGSLAS